MTSTQEPFEVRLAVIDDLQQLRSLECAAAQLFAQVPELAHFAGGGPSMSLQRQTELVGKKTIWIVGDTSCPQPYAASKPCAFLAADQVDSSLHIYELSVDPNYQRRGLANRLIDVAVQHAQAAGLKNVTLTTDIHVPWNGPMYAKRGFVEVSAQELGPEHLDILEHEKKDGLDLSRRCTMMGGFN